MRLFTPTRIQCALGALPAGAWGQIASSIAGRRAGPPDPQLRPAPSAAGGGAAFVSAPWIDLLTFSEVAELHPRLTRLRAILDATEFGFKLEQSRHATALLPIDAAFASLPLLESLPQLPYTLVRDILNTHIIPHELFKAAEHPDGVYDLVSNSGVTLKFVLETQNKRLDAGPPELNRSGASHADDGSVNAVSGDAGGLTNVSEPVLLRMPTAADGANGILDSLVSGGSAAVSDGSAARRTLRVFLGDQLVASADAAFVDTANGVAYLIDEVVLTEEMREAVRRAAVAAAATADSSAPPGFSDDAVPEFIKQTNQQHWLYGRVRREPEAAVAPTLVPTDGPRDGLAAKSGKNVERPRKGVLTVSQL